ncbi:TfuA-like protein [Marinomonas rhodophyticola]
MIDLTKPEFDIPVVRVIAPGLEGIHDVLGYVFGQRALNFSLKQENQERQEHQKRREQIVNSQSKESVIVFAGPSLSRKKALEILPNADVRPPAKQGDLYLATLDKPQIIVLIDGFFESVPAVWHKEILHAMSIGIHVYGSSSMGALRAAELNVFGMVGSGQIYERYASGEYEDDDEVALTHGPAELNYMLVSRAMVDLRHDLAGACNEGILTHAQAEILEKQLKSLWYPERTHTQLCSFAQDLLSTQHSTQGIASDKLEALRLFLKQHSQSLKELDAIHLLKDIAKIDLNTLAAKTVSYVLQENDAWYTLINDVVKQRQPKIDINLPSPTEPIKHLEEDKLPAKLRVLALERAQELGIDVKPWIRPAFHKVALAWQCISEDNRVEFEKMSQKIQALTLTTQQFDQWIEREALLMAYADQIAIQAEHILDESLIRTAI